MEEKKSQSRVGTLGEHGTGGRKVKRRAWLSNSVSKKGNRVLAWSVGMPNNKCPFASKVCSQYCYASTGQFTFHFERYAENYEFTTMPEFVETMTTEIVQFAESHPDEQISVAIHEKGEFDSIPYLGKWDEVISATKDLTNVTYFIYTRSWVSPPFRKALEELAKNHSNVKINLSVDSDMVAKYGVPKRIGNGLITYLAETDADVPPAGVDLVFRNLRMPHKGSLERLGDALVCPYESKLYIGLNKDGHPALERSKCKPIRCQECRLCIDRSLDEWEKVKERYAGTPGQEPVHKVEAAPANETECLFGADDFSMLLPSDQGDASRPTSDKECAWDAKIDRKNSRYQSEVIETCMDAVDDGGTISSYTRDRLTNTAIVIYQLANKILPQREKP